MIFDSRRLICLIAVIFLYLPTWAQGAKPLDIQSLTPELQEELIHHFPALEKGKVPLSEIDEITRYLQLKNQFDYVQVLEEGSEAYRLHVVLTRHIGILKIAGLESISESDAKNSLRLKSGDVFDQEALIEGSERIRQLYKEKGFLNTVIDIEMPPGQGNNVDINLKVIENKRTMIHQIVLNSANGELNKDLRKELKSEINEPFTDATLAEIQKKARHYLSKNQYIRAELSNPDIQSSQDESEVTLTYQLDKVERYNITLKGVELMRESSVEDALDLKSYYSGNPDVGAELNSKIRAYYLSKGYARVDVTTQEGDGKNSFEKRLTFKISEGPRIKIDKINVSGKLSQGPDYYADVLKKHSTKTIEDGYYVKDDIDTGLKNLILELQNNGYLQAKVVSTRTQYNKEKDKITLFVNLDEGPLTEIDDIKFEGNQTYTSEQLQDIIKLNPTGALKLGQLDNAVNSLKNYYHDHGYIDMLLLNEKEDLVTYDSTNTKAHLHFKIYEGPKVEVASIVLEGNDFTKDRVIIDELDFKVGETLTPAKIDESVSRLQRTGYFGTVEIKTLEDKTSIAQRTVIVKITERDPGLFTMGAGVTNERELTFRGFTSVGYSNLWGTGRGLSLRLDGDYNVTSIKYLESRIVLSYLEPHLFDTLLRGRINLSRSSLVTDYNLEVVTQINSTTYSIERDFGPHTVGTWDVWSLATIKQYSLTPSILSGSEVSDLSTLQNIDIATTGVSLDFDYRDNPFNPTKGNQTHLNAEYASPTLGSSNTIEYYRLLGSFSQYNNVGTFQGQSVIWANQVRGGYLQNLDHDANGGVPWDIKGFILGGRTTLHGYEAGTADVFPSYADLGTDPVLYNLTTAATMGLYKSELRFPVYGSLGGAVFYDGGYVSIQDLQMISNYRHSAGIGIRYNTPVGPLTLDWGWKLDKRPGEIPYHFDLAIGTF